MVLRTVQPEGMERRVFEEGVWRAAPSGSGDPHQGGPKTMPLLACRIATVRFGV